MTAAIVLDWLAASAYPVVFIGTLIDASGVPFPGRLLLVAAGALAAAGRHSVLLIIALAAVMSVAALVRSAQEAPTDIVAAEPVAPLSVAPLFRSFRPEAPPPRA